jgi:hypothetical protein
VLKAILRLIVIALVANATWHVFTAYLAHYRFKDAVEHASLVGSDLTNDQLRERVLDLAMQYDVPVGAEGFTVERLQRHTIIDGKYSRPVELLPSVPFAWPFSWRTDTLSFKPAAGEDPAAPIKP